jgi:hypothetical protein
MSQLKPIAENVWGLETELTMPGGLKLPSRATVVRREGGGLLIHSPLPIDDAAAKEIDALGEVTALVAPNVVHWMHVRAALERYPRARVFGAAGLEKKLTAKSGVTFEPLPLSGSLEGDELRVERIEGAPSMNEHVLLHTPSRTLIVSDLMFNVHGCSSFGMRLVLRVMGAYRKTAQSRMWRFLVKDRALAARSASTVLDWDFERVVVAHGEVVEDDARERARRALGWMTGGAPPLLGAGSVTA